MNQSLLFALISLIFAGANDALFKRQALSGQCKGQYMSVVGTVWLIVFSIAALLHGPFIPNRQTIVYGLSVGAISAIGNYLYIYSMNKLEASVAATIYRLNLALAACIAMIFLNENMTALNFLGVVFACLAVLLFAGKHLTDAAGMWATLCIAIIASIFRAFMGIGYKLAMNNGVNADWFLSGSGLCWLLVGISMAYLGKKQFSPARDTLINGFVSGFLVCGIVYFFAVALKTGKACIVIPIAQMSFIVTAIISFFLFKEKFSYTKIAGMLFACLSIILLGQ